uniref:Rho guanine nucleotide exchange factor 1 n=1 Tax=Malurus cyaneus samueli TaxID=2593467 RepID=A0A8C5U3I0_9PASS
MAFLQHVVLQFDSCPVLCYLHVDMLRRMNPKEGKKQFVEFCHLFLDKTGLLRVSVPHHVQFELERTRPELLSEETQRRFLQDIQSFQEAEISRQLEDFRSKRLMGMTPGEQELSELEWSRARDPSGSESKEKQLAEQLLARLEEMHLTISSDEEKSSIIFGAIVTYMKFLGVKTKGGDAKKSKSNFFRKKVNPHPPKSLRTPKPAQNPRPPFQSCFCQSTPTCRCCGCSWNSQIPPPKSLSRSPQTPSGTLKAPQDPRTLPISELFLTEHAHVRMLRVLLELFYQPMLHEGFFDEQELSNIFPSLEDLVEVHTLFLDSLKKLREESGFIITEIGDVLGPQNEAESRPRCRRLQLKDIIPTEMQRLTKYPLLLLSITKCTEAAAERAKVEQAAECCRQILNHVNQEVRDMENLMKLKDYQRRLDLSNLKQSTDPLLSEFKNTDITKRTLVHEGPLTWRIARDKAVEVQVLLLDDLLVLLQRQEERLVLRCHSRALAAAPDGKQMLSPVIRLRSAMTREVATGPGGCLLGGSPRVLGRSPRFEGVRFGRARLGSGSFGVPRSLFWGM